MGQSSSQLDQPALSQLETDYGRSVSTTPTPALTPPPAPPPALSESKSDDTVVQKQTIRRSQGRRRKDVYEIPVSPVKSTTRSRTTRTSRKSHQIPDAKPVVARDQNTDEAAEAEVEAQDRPRKRQRKAVAPPAQHRAQVQVPASQLPPSDDNNKTSPQTSATPYPIISGSVPEPQVIISASEQQQATRDLVQQQSVDAMIPETQDGAGPTMLLQEPVEFAKKTRKRKKRQSTASDDNMVKAEMGKDGVGYTQPAPSAEIHEADAKDRKRTSRKKKPREIKKRSERQATSGAEAQSAPEETQVAVEEPASQAGYLERDEERKLSTAEPEDAPDMLGRIESKPGLGMMDTQDDTRLPDVTALPADIENEEEPADEPAHQEEGLEQEGGDNPWPTSDDPEVQALLADRDWRNGLELLEVEPVPAKSQLERDRQMRIVTKARNKLRAHCERLLYEQKIFKGMAREVQDENGTMYAEYAEEGTKFEIPDRSTAEIKAAKKRQKSMKRLRQSLVESLAQSEVEARRRAGRDDGPELGQADKETVEGDAMPGDHAEGEEEAGPQERADLADEACAEDRRHGEEAALDEHADGGDVANRPGNAGQAAIGENIPIRQLERDGQVKDPDELQAPREKRARKARESAPAAPKAGSGRPLVPTPPTSEEHQLRYSVLHNTKTQDTTSQVTSWLASQDEVPQHPPNEPLEAPSASRKRKRDRRSTLHADDDEEFEAPPSAVAPHDSTSVRAEAMDAPATGSRADKPPPSKAKRKSTEQSITQAERRRTTITLISGPFDNDEKATADRVFASVMRREGMSRSELSAVIQDWKNATVFKDDILALFPERSKTAVRKFCQRRYHDQERGPWTDEQDQALKKAHAGNPDKWSIISQSVGRTAADCKDRWTKHLQYREQDTGPWSLEQESQLLAAVKECLKVIKKERKNDGELVQNSGPLEALINWKVVSEKLNGRRTADRCREKYQKIKLAEARNHQSGNPVDSTNITSASIGDGAKLEAAMTTVSNRFEIGDYYDVFVEIYTSFKDHNQHFRDEKSVLWSIVSSKNTNSRFALYQAPGALRRAALEKAIEEWPKTNPKIKGRLDKVDSVPAKALVLAQWIEKRSTGLGTMRRTYKPEMIGKSAEELAKIKHDRKLLYKKRNSVKHDLSRFYIEDSDDELQADGGNPIPSFVQNYHVDDVNADPVSSVESEESDVKQQPIGFDQDTPMTDVESLNAKPKISPADFVERLKSGGSSGRKKTAG